MVLLVQALHLKDGSAFNLSLIFEHLLGTQRLRLWQKIELLPTPLRLILHGHFTGSHLADELCLLHASFVILTLTQSPFASILFLQFVKSSNFSAINTRSSM